MDKLVDYLFGACRCGPGRWAPAHAASDEVVLVYEPVVPFNIILDFYSIRTAPSTPSTVVDVISSLPLALIVWLLLSSSKQPVRSLLWLADPAVAIVFWDSTARPEDLPLLAYSLSSSLSADDVGSRCRGWRRCDAIPERTKGRGRMDGCSQAG